jgi:hypothetical protein
VRFNSFYRLSIQYNYLYLNIETNKQKQNKMITLENTIETVTIEKYTFTIYKRDSSNRFPNSPFAVMYEKATPKAKWSKTKMIEHFVFATVEACEEYVIRKHTNLFKNLKADRIRKEEKREAQKTIKATDFYKMGDIVSNSWGYEQTNVDFAQVVKITKKTIIVRPISQKVEEGSIGNSGMSQNVSGVQDSFLDNGEDLRLTVRPEGRLGGGASYACWSKWDGRPKYSSSYY